ncbi:hypothetical protein BDV25DRAFT_165775 [Aspergillus avenaceus]|uniref:TPR domain protein n=1 Tax=Aspergillus avenaceus TaxID=36643 RepID=A0A5N6TEW8_ASPAV|nr:hypothetical protein BDV25DRAFT_165775 [Aspergillus avenaceus]
MFTAASRRATAIPRTRCLQQQQQKQICTRSPPRPSSLTQFQPPKTLLHQNLGTRQLSYAQKWKQGFREASKGIWRKNPVVLPLAIVSVVGATALFAYIAYTEYVYVAPQYHKFPPPVAQSLRTAVYYTEVDLNPPKALEAYKLALRMAVEMGMHPFSDEVLGIKLQVAMMLEKAGLVNPAVDVLERTKREALNWVEEGRKRAALREKEVAAGEHKQETVQVADEEVLEVQRRMQELEEYEERQRNKTLKKAIGIEMKLAELYSSDYVQDEKKAETAQVAAVELCLKELNRRQSLGLPVGVNATEDDSWMTPAEIATALSDLAVMYANQEKYALSMPLYLRALDFLRADEGDSPTCKQVVLLNNVASAMAEQAQKPIKAADPKKAREHLIDAARQWAQKSLDVAARIAPPVRDEDCDTSCVVATYNLGELAELQGKPKEAAKLYREAKSLAHGLSFEDGEAMAEAALQRITKK